MLLVITLTVLAQAEPQEPARPVAADPRQRGAEARKEARDRALRVAGKEALGFTRHYGDLAVQAVLHCQKPETARRLVELHESGELSKLSNPRAALEAVCRHGEPAAVFLGAHAASLADPDALECFVAAPLDFAFELRDLEQQAAERRASRRSVFNVAQSELQADGWKALAAFSGVALTGGLLGYWLRARRAASA